MAAIFPSLISADLLSLGATINELSPYCTGYHIDVMDGHFVPSITWGDPFIKAIRKATNAPLWVHLMVDNPAICIQSLMQSSDTLGNTIITFHLEPFLIAHEIVHVPNQNTCMTYANSHIQKVLDLAHSIRKNGQRPSIALNPFTPVNYLFPLMPTIDHVLIMSVHPGKSGQCFLSETDTKIKALVDYIQTHDISISIGVDGGITHEHCARLAALGVEHFAAAAAIFHTADPLHALKELQNIPQKVLHTDVEN